MTAEPHTPSKKWPRKKTILIAAAVILIASVFLLYLNFNKLVSIALNKSFESSIFSDVYQLKFENLRVDPFQGNIGVHNVTLEPKENSAYPYINTTIRLKTESLKLEKVDIMRLLESNELFLEKISISKPDVELVVNSLNPILFPFKPSADEEKAGAKKSLDSYFLQEFKLVDASFSVVNTAKKRDFKIQNVGISLRDLLIKRNPGEDQISLQNIDISLKKFLGNLEEGPLQHLKFSEFELKFDSVGIQNNLDTLIFQFRDFNALVDSLDIQTEDSLFYVKMDAFNLAYLDQSIQMRGLSFIPNVSNSEIQKNYKYQHSQFSGTINSLDIKGLNFDSLMYGNKLFVDEVVLDSVSASIFKDNTKPKDLNRFPEYLGQTIAKIETPLWIKSVKATKVNLTNEERKPDGTTAKVQISNGSAEVKNITNLATEEELVLQATADLAGKVQTKLTLKFSYLKPQFSFQGSLSPFALSHLNPIIKAYTPAEIKNGVADEINFTGLATNKEASGTMKFLYHDLEIDLKLKEQAKWKNSVVTFGANTALISKNPISEGSPERVVGFTAERDMNKGFINLIIKSVINGMKETMIMSKDNRKQFNHLKKETRREARKEAKKEKN